MIKEHISSVTTKFEGDVSPLRQKKLEQQLETVSDDKYETVMSVKTKRLKLTVLLSALLGLFGVGSFYLGQFKRGICKVVFNVVVPLTLSLVFLYWFAPLHREYSIQSKDIYNAVTVNEQYEYSLDNLKLVQTAYNNAYKSFNDNISNVVTQTNQLTSVKDYILGKNDEISVNETRYSFFIDQLGIFAGNSVIVNLSNEIDNSLKILDDLTSEEEKEENKEFKELIGEVNKIFAAQDFLLNSVSISDRAELYVGLIEDLMPKLDDLIEAKTFDTVTSALNELKPCLNVISQNYGTLYSNIAVINSSGINSLKNKISSLNNKVFDKQKEQEINTVEEAKDTDLGLLITEFGKAYTELCEIEIEEELTVKSFLDKFTTQVVKPKSSLESIDKSAYTGDGGNNITDLINELKLQKDTFVEQNQTYIEYLNNDFVNDLKHTNAKLPETEKNAVDNRVLLSETLSECCLLLDDIKSGDNIDTIQLNVNEVSKEISGLQTRADDAYYHYRFNFMFVDIFFTMLLSVDVIVILVYWIFEVFRNREKCQDINYNNITQALR